MSVVETEETGVRLAPPSIDYGAGVPFKKRRFPFIQPPSPLLLQDESTEVKQSEFFSPSDVFVVLKSSVAVEHPPSSVEKEPSFRLESSENINLNEVDGAQSYDQDKHLSLIQKCPKFSEGRELSPSSNVSNVDKKDKPDEKENSVLSDITWGSTELMSVPRGSHESEVNQGSGGHQNLEGYGISTDLTLTFGQNIGPVCWHQVNSSLSGRESEHCLVGDDRSNWDLNATMDESGRSALVLSYGTAPCGNLISALRENDKKDTGHNLHMIEHRSVGERTASSYDYKEHHPGRCLDLNLWPSIPYTNLRHEAYQKKNLRHEAPSVCAIYKPVLHLSTAVKIDNSKGINSWSRVKIEPANGPVDFCDRKTENISGKCGSICSLQFGTHLGNSRSIKVETDCTNQQMNMMNENSTSQHEMSDFPALLPKESEAMHINGPPGVESCQSVLASSVGCSDEHLIGNDDNTMGQSLHRPEGDAGNASAGTVTNVATNGSEVQTSRLMIMERDENNKKRDDDMAELTKEDPPAGKDIVKDDGEDSACNGGKIEISGCEDSDSCDSNYESDKALSVPSDHAEISAEEDDDYEDGEVREQFVFGVSRVGRGAEQVENVRAGYCTRVTSTDLSVACEEANVELQLTATAACTRNVDKDQSQSRELSLKERVSSNPDCSFDLGILLDGDLTKRIKEEMGEPCQSSAVNAPSVTQLGVNERVQIDKAISIEGKEDGSFLPETEVLVNSEVTSKDANVEGNKRRIITLSSLSSVSSPDKARFVTNRPLQMRSVRKRLPDMALEVDKPHLRGRNRARTDEFDKLSSGGNQYSFYRNSRSKFGRDKGIVSNSIIRNRDVKRDFSPELYNYPVECHTTRCRYASGYQSSNLASEGRISGDGCWGRRGFNSDGPCFRWQSSMRHTPGRRDGAPARALPRDISPVGCIGMNGFDMVRMRSNSKFRRDPRDDNFDSMFACSRISCDYDASGIACGDRKLPSFKSFRVLVCSRSNSPVIRSRSPVQGSNRRRSPEGFRGHFELSHRRSPAVHRGSRMRSRSPGRGSFHGMMMRRQNPHLSQNLEEARQIRSERDDLFQRSRLPSRSLPGRGTFRVRRYGVNIRDGPCSEYSKGTMRTLWSKDISQQGENDERSLNEEGGHGRFPSPYDESDESDMYSTDEAAAPYHFCPEDRPVYRERGKSRVKQIVTTKNRSGYIRKSHKMDQEGSYRRRRLCEEFDDDHGTRKGFRNPGLQYQEESYSQRRLREEFDYDHGTRKRFRDPGLQE